MRKGYCFLITAALCAFLFACKNTSAETPFGNIDDVPVLIDTEAVVERLKRFLSLRYKEDDVRIAYEEFYPQAYKDTLLKARGVRNAHEYVLSNPEVDFELVATITTIRSITTNNNTVTVVAETEAYDSLSRSKDAYEQTFRMRYEEGKWVYLFPLMP